MKSSAAMLILGMALLFAVPTSAAIDEEPAAIIQPEEALRRAVQLRAEAAAHQEMEHQFTAMTGGSRGERRWRRTMIRLCREYAASAIQTAGAYERAAAPASKSPAAEPQDSLPHPSLPVTAAEYDARASEYKVQAESFRADADRHLAMLRSSSYDPQQPYISGAPAQTRRGGLFESPRDGTAREHCRDIAQQNVDLARDADNIARHYRLRARQLQAAR